MKHLALLFLPLVAVAQVARFSAVPVLPLYHVTIDGYPCIGGTSCTVTNDDPHRALTVRVDSLSDTVDFAWAGILGTIPRRDSTEPEPSPGFLRTNQRRIDFTARRSVAHDTSCIAYLSTNDPLQRAVALTIHGTATTGVRERAYPGAPERWYDLLGRACDSTARGVVFSRARRVVNVQRKRACFSAYGAHGRSCFLH